MGEQLDDHRGIGDLLNAESIEKGSLGKVDSKEALRSPGNPTGLLIVDAEIAEKL